MAPQAMVMKTKGKTAPGMIGPPPWTNWVTAGICSSGWTTDDADGQHDDGADLQVGGEVVAGAEQQPDRQDRGHESVDGDDDGDLFLGRV